MTPARQCKKISLAWIMLYYFILHYHHDHGWGHIIMHLDIRQINVPDSLYSHTKLSCFTLYYNMASGALTTVVPYVQYWQSQVGVLLAVEQKYTSLLLVSVLLTWLTGQKIQLVYVSCYMFSIHTSKHPHLPLITIKIPLDQSLFTCFSLIGYRYSSEIPQD